MRIDILSLFPQIAAGALGESIMKRAQERGFVQIRSHNLRDWARDKHHVTDEPPYGGGPGMVMKCEPIFEALEAVRRDAGNRKEDLAGLPKKLNSRVVLMSPAGRRFDQQLAAEFASIDHLIVLCGHYEGVDQRVVDHLIDDEISIGDYVLTNGVIAAIVFIDAIVRLIPGVLGDEQSAPEDSFANGLLEYPHYTRPDEFRGWRVPEVLLSGNHAAIAAWRRAQAIAKTRRTRPDLWKEGASEAKD